MIFGEKKRMYDSSLSLFLKILSDKVAETGQKVIKVHPTYTSQDGSNCYKRAFIKLEFLFVFFVD